MIKADPFSEEFWCTGKQTGSHKRRIPLPMAETTDCIRSPKDVRILRVIMVIIKAWMMIICYQRHLLIYQESSV